MNKKTAILGASPNPNRYSYLAAQRLTANDYDIVPIGIKRGEVFGKDILDIRKEPDVKDIDTITMYIGPKHQQEELESYILSLKPKRIIFNPGSENPSLASKAKEQGIEVQFACTLVMLANGLY